jgi:hypothetical protein
MTDPQIPSNFDSKARTEHAMGQVIYWMIKSQFEPDEALRAEYREEAEKWFYTWAL